MNIVNNIRIIERGEPLTRQEFNEIVESRAFALFMARIDKMIEAERATCEQTVDVEKWRRTQGTLSALKTVRSLPGILEAELPARSSNGGK